MYLKQNFSSEKVSKSQKIYHKTKAFNVIIIFLWIESIFNQKQVVVLGRTDANKKIASEAISNG